MQSPDQSFLIQNLRSIIIHSIDTFNYNNAEFASERLLALDSSNLDSIYLYCLTLIHKGRYKGCFNYLSDTSDHLGCSYLYAKLCLNLKKYKEGVYRLLRIEHLYNDTSREEDGGAYYLTAEFRMNYESKRMIGPDQLSVYHLLGDLYNGMGDIKNSALSYSQCLKFNQFDFEAFQKLSKLGVNVRVKAIYKTREFGKSAQVPLYLVTSPSSNNSVSGGNGVSNPFSATPPNKPKIHQDESNTSFGSNNTNNVTPRPKALFLDAPLRRSSHFDSNNSGSSRLLSETFTKPNFPLESVVDSRRKRENSYSNITSRLIANPTQSNARGLKRSTEQTSSASGNNNNAINNNGSSGGSLGNGSSNNNSQGVGGGSGNGNNTTTSSSSVGTSSTPAIVVQRRIENSERYLLSLYVIFAKGFKSLCKYDCYKAIRILELLPDNEKETPWVLSKLGRLHYEIVNYKTSEYFFIKLRQLDRTRLEDMEYYLTLLWHLHKKVELTYLANELYDLDNESAITWCVIGNLFSVTREPDEAIKCFNKSIKLNDSFTYAYTLKGHEYFSNDNYELALENFRISLLHDPRHYNALYGIGMVYINLGDYQKADYHFRKAISINPINIILICCIGMVLEKVGKKPLALKQYELANKLQPLNVLPIFKKAQLLFSMQQFTQALKYFEILKDLAPDEASVHFLLGQLYKLHNEKYKAIREFTIALNLDPKGNYLIREAMESLKA